MDLESVSTHDFETVHFEQFWIDMESIRSTSNHTWTKIRFRRFFEPKLKDFCMETGNLSSKNI